MIDRVRGVLAATTADSIVVDVGGVGLRVFVPLTTRSALGPVGSPVELRTVLHLREDTLALYGFLTEDERQLFEQLLTVTGVGPRVALNLLSVLTPDRLRTAIAAGDVELLTTVPGVGRKLAGRLVLELRGKLPTPAPAGGPGSDLDEVAAALQGLGYSPAEVQTALRALALDPALPLEEKIRRALQFFATARR